MAALPPIDEDLVGALEALADTLGARTDHADLAARLEWLIDTLILRDQLPPRFKQLAAKVHGDKAKVQLAMFRDKYAVSNNEIDCAARLHLCGARCCTFDVTLSAQDVAEGKLPFVIEQPYMLPRDPDTKRCVCMDADGACTVYAHRPGACRIYDCRNDARVWIDFEARIATPRAAPGDH
ncbi:MAG: YkgJ family cysteine cluster protein [Kofleriaceae bacterium]